MSRRDRDPLAAALAAGSEQAFAELYDRFGGRLYRAALSMLGRPEDAEDTVQELFTAMARSREKLADVRDLTAYLFAALRRAAGRCAARRGREPATSLAVQDTPAPRQDRGPAHPAAERLDRALRRLPAEQREVVALKIDGGLTFARIAEVIGISPDTAASRYRYALQKLRAALEE